MRQRTIGVRWTVGDVSEAGFEALRLSIWGAYRLFGSAAEYAVCVNSLSAGVARGRTGPVPEVVAWRDASTELPDFMRERLDEGMAQGVGWKFAPLRCFGDRPELSLDNDCILWDMPAALREWLAEGGEGGSVLAEDVRRCFGRFESLCGPAPRNSGIRGVPASLDLEEALRAVLAEVPGPLTSELDEQGLQVAALSRVGRVRVVGTHEVSICSPFPPHVSCLGRCGVHFVGLNTRRASWSLNGRSAEEHLRENWERLRPAVRERVGLR